MLTQRFSTTETIRIGVLLAPPPVQFMDIAPVDLFHMLSKEYLGGVTMLPQAVRNLALQDLRIMYIADEVPQGQSMDTSGTDSKTQSVPLTADAHIEITSTLKDPNVEPGKLSILVIPGPDPNTTTPEAYRSFIAGHAAGGTTDIITICTGIIPACYSGVCDDRVVSAPRGFTAELKKKFQRVKAFEDTRWSKDLLESGSTKVESGQRRAELWTAGGITNGHDCIAAYMREHFNLEIAEIVCRMADVGDRGQHYTTGQFSEGAWWMSRILKTIIKGLWR